MRFVAGHQRRKSPVEYVVDEATGCWIWQRGKTTAGYGMSGERDRHGNRLYAHRAIYLRERGPIPKNWQLHHLCETPACVNPDHLVALQPGVHSTLHPKNNVLWLKGRISRLESFIRDQGLEPPP